MSLLLKHLDRTVHHELPTHLPALARANAAVDVMRRYRLLEHLDKHPRPGRREVGVRETPINARVGFILRCVNEFSAKVKKDCHGMDQIERPVARQQPVGEEDDSHLRWPHASWSLPFQRSSLPFQPRLGMLAPFFCCVNVHICQDFPRLEERLVTLTNHLRPVIIRRKDEKLRTCGHTARCHEVYLSVCCRVAPPLGQRLAIRSTLKESTRCRQLVVQRSVRLRAHVGQQDEREPRTLEPRQRLLCTRDQAAWLIDGAVAIKDETGDLLAFRVIWIPLSSFRHNLTVSAEVADPFSAINLG
mmetsp:Transcript_38324/g.63429  ORF Transcript_38324/g.63429 Transcript_38324/m.63429 type:complete len:302 (-) Transcript_38324:10-915(-)